MTRIRECDTIQLLFEQEGRSLLKLSVVVPCYNEGDNIVDFYRESEAALHDIIGDTEFIFVNDGSSDDTGRRLSELCAKEGTSITAVEFSRNFGKEAAILAGLERSRGEYTAIIDADLQQRPEYVRQMTEFLDQHPEYDCVAAYQAQRKEGRGQAFFKDRFYKIFNRTTEVELRASASDFRVMRRNMVQAVLSLKEKIRFSKGIFSWVGYNTYYMPYKVEERHAGSSKWNFFKLTRYALDGIMSFSDMPLKAALYLGVCLGLVSLTMLIAIIVQAALPGVFVSKLLIGLFFAFLLSGINLAALGIVGVYLARVYREVKGRPVYIIKSVQESSRNKKE